MSDRLNTLDDPEFEALCISYDAELPAELQQIHRLLQRLMCDDHRTEYQQTLGDVRYAAHNVAGTAGTFGFVQVSKAAKILEEIALGILDGKHLPTDAQLTEIENAFRNLRAVAPVPRCDHKPANPGPDDTRDDKKQPIVIVNDRDETSDTLSKGLEVLGYNACIISQREDVLNRIGPLSPKAVLVSTSITRWPDILKKISEELHSSYDAIVPIICTAVSDNFDYRLKALRAGASGFLAEPTSPEETVGLIEDISKRAAFEPHRVLIVSDDELIASQCVAALDGPGYATEVCKDCRQVLSVIASYKPQLIVSDLCLSSCSGLELAMIIWQSDFGRDLETVFLSPSPEFNDLFSGLGVPSDGLITRPIDSSKLRACISDRLVRLKSGNGRGTRDYFISALSQRKNLDLLHEFLGLPPRNEPRSDLPHYTEPSPKPRVLVVDDDPRIVTAIKVKLERFGIEVLEAFNGIQGFKAACREQPDAIISDYEMPRASGDYLLTRLKEAPRTRSIPVLILTARKFDGGKDFALEREMLGRHGAVSYLGKPIDWDELVTELGRHISV